MLKKIAMLAATAALALSLPCLAFADASPEASTITATGNNGSTITVQPSSANDAPLLVVEPEATPAASASMAVGTVIDTFSVYMTDGSDLNGSVTLTFNVGKQYAGKTAHIYVVHGRDASGAATEIATKVVTAEGTVSITVDSLSYYTVSVDENTTGVASDSSAKSPSTGASPLTMAVVAGAALVVAAGAVVVARKKISE